MLAICPECGKYTIDQPCYECLAKERDRYKTLATPTVAALTRELDKYKRLYELALGACPRCRENCVIRCLDTAGATGK